MARQPHTAAEQLLIDRAVKRLQDHFSCEVERRQIREAAELAQRWHAGQRRRSGEPFVTHPLAVAEILAQEGLAVDTVTAGILHDLLEDTDCPKQEIEQRFGREVTAMVEALTKMVKVAPRGSPQREKLATYRKLLLAAADDARVLVIKLADRLHNMRTVSAMPHTRQQAIARETLEVYAPLAHRLGMSLIKEELEDRSLAVLDRRAWEEAGMIREERVGRFRHLLDSLIEEVEQAMAEQGIEGEVSMRVKSLYSIAEKLKRDRDPDELYDIVGVRVIVREVDDCYRVLGIVHRLWPPQFDRIKDYIAVPKANLYQSLHTTVVTPKGLVVEVQIRTERMHQIAEHGIAAHWLYKETLRHGGPASTKAFIGQVAEGQAHAPTLDEAFALLKKDVFSDEIYVFTPRGDIKLLPAGSCAIDFAYAIHTELGHRCSGARINGVHQPITRPLQNGDVVEIIRGSRAYPPRDWLEHVASSRARSAIRSFHQAATVKERVERGTKALMQALRATQLGPLAQPERLAEALQEIGYQTLDQAALEAAEGEARVDAIVKRLVRKLAQPQSAPRIPPSQRRRLRPDREMGVIVDGLEGVQVRLAQCCAPEPGDELLGYVSLNRGVSVHRKDCNQLAQLRRSDNPRIVQVEWAADRKESFATRLDLVYTDRRGLLAEILHTIDSLGADLTEAHLKGDGDGKVARGYVVCRVGSPAQSEELRRRLGALEGALRVRRHHS